MYLAIDVHYHDCGAIAAGVAFRQWNDKTSLSTHIIQAAPAADYTPGQFYQRELPPILELLDSLPQYPEIIITDSYVWLEKERPGLGVYLYQALDEQIPIIGVAKNHFRTANDVEVAITRGQSNKALFVTSVGVEVCWAAERIQRMDGPYRIPTLLKLADQLCRSHPTDC